MVNGELNVRLTVYFFQNKPVAAISAAVASTSGYEGIGGGIGGFFQADDFTCDQCNEAAAAAARIGASSILAAGIDLATCGKFDDGGA